MAYAVIFSNEAGLDLDGIVDYIAQYDSEIAHRLGRNLLVHAQSLAENPRIGMRIRSRSIRYVVHRPYLIFYKINDDLRVIEILRFWHGARNPGSLRFGV